MSKSKSIGTRFESALVSWLHAQGETGAERLALHGSADEGDVGNFRISGLPAVAECKCHKRWSKADLERWQAETRAERRARGAIVGVLVVHKANCGEARFGQNHAYVTFRDLQLMTTGGAASIDALDEMWARLDLDTLARVMRMGTGRDCDEIGG